MADEKKNQIPAEQEVNVNELRKIRVEKLENLQKAGKDPFKITTANQEYHTVDIAEKFDELENKDVSVAGRIMSKRPMGKAGFININDRDGKIQVYVRRDDIGEEEYADFKKYDIGDIVEVTGFVFKTKTGEFSIHAKSVKLLT